MHGGQDGGNGFDVPPERVRPKEVVDVFPSAEEGSYVVSEEWTVPERIVGRVELLSGLAYARPEEAVPSLESTIR